MFHPVTKMERKIDSYTEMIGPRGYHWRDQLSIPYEAPRACKPLVGDYDLDQEAKLQQRFIELTMPTSVKTMLKAIKMPTPLSMVKHVDDGNVVKIKPPSKWDRSHGRAMKDAKWRLRSRSSKNSGGPSVMRNLISIAISSRLTNRMRMRCKIKATSRRLKAGRFSSSDSHESLHVTGGRFD